MKASEMICLLAKQIEMNGDREVTLAVDYLDTYEGIQYPKSVTWDEQQRTIEIYGE
jgi:hypothetical protein